MKTRILLLALALGGCAAQATLHPKNGYHHALGRSHPLLGKVWSRHERSLVGARQLLDRVRSSAYVLLGETHDNADHHQLQAQLLEAWLSAHPHGAVSFEMLDESQAAALTPPLPESADELASKVDWANSGWPDFALYKPVFTTLLAKQARIIAAHPSREHLRAVMHGNQPAPTGDLQLAPALPTPARDALREEIRESHCGHAPEPMVEAMIRAQNYKDAFMANALVRSGSAGALIAGRGHILEKRGVPVYLTRHHVEDILTVALVEVDDQKVAPESYDLASYDFAIFTPRVTDESACEAFRAQLEKMKKAPQN